MKPHLLLLLAATLLAQADVTLQRAIRKETLEGDLKGAIALYEKAANEAKSDRKLAARALLRLAEAHAKLGDANSRKVYERIVRDFADQPDAVTTARARLGASPASNAAGITTRQLWTGKDVQVSLGLAPDGTSVVFPSPGRPGLTIRDLRSGKSTEILKGTADEIAEHDWIVSPCFSRDGKRLAYFWAFGKLAGGQRTGELRIVNIDGTNPRAIARFELGKDGTVKPFDWAPDGRTVVVGEFKDWKGVNLVLVSTEDGSLRHMASLPLPMPHQARFSPDGKYLLFNSRTPGDSNESSIFTFAVGGSGSPQLLRQRGIAPIWSVDGKHALYVKSQTTELWSLPISAGKAAGEPKLVKAGLGATVFPIGVAANGSYHFGVMNAVQDIRVATLDPASAEVGPASTISEESAGRIVAPRWSPDGEWLAYQYGEFGLSSLAPRPLRITLRSTRTGVERSLFVGDNTRGRWNSEMSWFPDGSALLVKSLEDGGAKMSFYRVDIKSGTATLLEKNIANYAEISLDGKRIYYMTLRTIYVHDLETGRDTELYRIPALSMLGLALSKDGQNLAFLQHIPGSPNRTALMILPVAGGRPKEVTRFAQMLWAPQIDWTPDGRYIFAGNHRVAVQDGKASRLAAMDATIFNTAIHPDGKRIAFGLLGPRTSELWALDNYLP